MASLFRAPGCFRYLPYILKVIESTVQAFLEKNNVLMTSISPAQSLSLCMMSGIKTLTETEEEKDSSTVEHNSNLFPSQFVYETKFKGQRTSIPVGKHPKILKKVEARLSKEIVGEDDNIIYPDNKPKQIFRDLSKTCQKNRAKISLLCEEKVKPTCLK